MSERSAVRSLSPVQRLLLQPETNVSPVLAPDGSSIAYLRQASVGVSVMVADARAYRPIAEHRSACVEDLAWTHADWLFYRLIRADGRGWRLIQARVSTGELDELPVPGPVLRFWTSADSARDVIIVTRPDTRSPVGLFRATFGATDVAMVPGSAGCHDWFVDRRLNVGGGVQITGDGSTRIMLAAAGGPATVHTVDADSASDFQALRYDATTSALYVLDSTGRARRGLWRLTPSARDLIYEHPSLDIASYPIGKPGVWFDPRHGRPVLCSVFGRRLQYIPLLGEPGRRRYDDSWLADPGDHEQRLLLDTDSSNAISLVARVRDNAPMGYATFEHATARWSDLMVNRPELCGEPLAGLDDLDAGVVEGRHLTGYAMQPRRAERPAPTVVMVHGGPASRDIWRFNAEAHVFAAAGYRCLQVNFRGSSGQGKAFRVSGDGHWGDGMLRDLYAAVEQEIRRGLVDPARLAFFGMSYGGYAALMAAAERADLVRCSVAINPVCDLPAFAQSPPPFWRLLAPAIRRQVLTAADGMRLSASALQRQSPLHRLSAAAAPTLLAWGARDPRIDTDAIARYLQRAAEVGAHVEALRYEDEGHTISGTDSREHLFAELLGFLERELQ